MKKALLGLVAVLLVGIVWLAWGASGEDAPAADTTEGAAPHGEQAPAPLEAPTAGEKAQAALAATSPSPGERVEVEPAGPEPAQTVTLRGRCVDAATGAPLAGCTVEVHGWGANSTRMDAYLKDHEEVVWEDPPVATTGADGAFSFTFVPPPPYQFALDIRSPATVCVTGRWSALEPGTVKDFGDVPLPRGSAVGGRVVDADGVPQGDVQVNIDQYNRGPVDELSHRRGYQTRSRADGTFSFDEPIAFGRWDLDLRGRQKVAPDALEIPDGQTVTMLAIETKPVGDVETITGVVVDDSGVPVRGATVRYTPSRGGGGWIISTDRAGRFRVERKEGDPDGPIQLSFQREGFEHLTSEERYPWGMQGLELVMRRGLSVDIVVVDGHTGEPIEDYGVRCFPDPAANRGFSSRDYEVRARGHHPGGRATIEGITRGANVLVVEPQGERWQTSDFIAFELTDRGTPVQRVELLEAVTRTLRVQRASGKPVAGTEVELLRPLGETHVTMATHVVEMTQLYAYSGPEKAVALMRGRTDAHGELALRGPLALRVLGPGHQPVVEPEVMLAPDAPPLVVAVPTGATVAGRIVPAALLEQLQPSDEMLAQLGGNAEAMRQLRSRRAPGLVFTRERAGERESFPADPFAGRLPLDEDGTFEIRGMPPGTWDVHLAYTIDLGSGASTGGSEFVRTLSDLAEGQVRALEADLGHLLPASLTGVVLMNDVPLEDARVQLTGTKPDGRGGEQQVAGPSPQLAKGGRFAVMLMPATYRLYVVVQREPAQWIRLPAVETVAPRAGQQLHQVFHLHTGSLRLRVRGENGQPVAGVALQLVSVDRAWNQQLTATDGEGRVTLDLAPIGSIAISVLPKHLTDPRTRRAFWEANEGNPDAWQQTIVQLGHVEVVGGEDAAEVEIELPASAGY